MHAPRRHKRLKYPSAVALLKLDHKLSKNELKRLVKHMNSTHYIDDDYEVEAVYPNYIFKGSALEAAAVVESIGAAANTYKWASAKGRGVVVAVIDSGVNYNHPDLAKNIWHNEDEKLNGKDDDHNGYIDDIRGYDFVKKAGPQCIRDEDCRDRDNDPMDYDGHGSHVAGIIAANNNGKGVRGVAPEAKIMPLRASYSSGRSTYLLSSDIYDAIVYAIDNNADVINMSFSGPGLGVLHEVIKIADELGIVMAAAAGNSNRPWKQYPAALDEVIAVGAIGLDGTKAEYSNYGDWVDIAAPGTAIFSTGSQRKPYFFNTGTSMATPYVTGVAALIKAKDKVGAMPAKEIRQRIISAATPSSFKPILNPDIHLPVEVDKMDMPKVAAVGQSISFVGSGSSDGQDADGFEWVSNIDGKLSSSASFTSSSLSAGVHKISFRVRANNQWSRPVHKTLHIVELENFVRLGNKSIPVEIIRKRKALVANSSKEALKSIKHYIWESNVDGVLPDSRVLKLSKLSKGFHKITLVVQGVDGSSSEPVDAFVQVK